MLLKGEGESADHIVGGAEWSTLSHDAFPAQEFDFMLSNPPYGKSWKKDLEAMGGKDGMRDPRFKVMHEGEELSLVTRSSDGQMLFLANMASKMNHKSPLGSRIAEVHNGSSLFTGDAGQGESNIRRWLIENDWLEAIVALPLNLFYNTGIATYIWVLSNRKPDAPPGPGAAHRRQRSGSSRCARTSARRTASCRPRTSSASAAPSSTSRKRAQSKIFPNAAFGYWKVTVERPLRLHSQLTLKAIETLRFASGDEDLARDTLRGVRRRPVHQSSPRSRRRWKAPGRLGQRRRRRRRRRGRQPKKGLPEKKKKETARLQDLGARRPPGRSRHEAARRHWATGCSRTTTSSASAWTTHSSRLDIKARRRRPEADPQGRELARGDRAARHRQGPQARERRRPTRCMASTS